MHIHYNNPHFNGTYFPTLKWARKYGELKGYLAPFCELIGYNNIGRNMANLAISSSLARGPAVVVGGDGCRASALGVLKRENIPAFECDSPYPAMAEISRKPGVYKTVILSLQNLFQEELRIIEAIKTLHPEIDIWLCHTDGRPSTLAAALRMGADGILADDGIHRMAPNAEIVETPIVKTAPPAQPPVVAASAQDKLSASSNSSPVITSSGLVEPILTVEELRALLQDPGE